MCSDGWCLDEDEHPDGVCPDCGEPTLGGYATEGCNYSPVICDTCGDAPCDQYC